MYSFRDVSALALALSNADGRAEEGAEGDAAAAFPALPCDLVLAAFAGTTAERLRESVSATRTGDAQRGEGGRGVQQRDAASEEGQ